MIRLLWWLMAIPLFLSASLDEKSNLHKVSLQLQWKHQFEYAGFYAAKEKGYYKDVGLEVDFHEYEPNMDLIQEVLDGRQEFGIEASSLIRERLNGKPVQMLANYFKRSPLVIVTKPEIRLPSDLKNKRLMISSKDLNGANFLQMWRDFGVDPHQDIKIVPHSFNIDDFIQGKVDALSIFLTNELYTLQQKRVLYNVLDPNNYGTEMYDVNLFTSQVYAEKHPKIVRDFTEASHRGWQYALEHPEEIIELIFKKYNTQKKSRDALLFEAKEIEKIMLPKIYPIGSIDESRIRKVAELFVQMGEAKSMDNFEGFVFDFSQEKTESQPTTLSDQITLTKEERLWLQRHPMIRIYNDKGYPPFDYNVHGEAKGFTVELLKELAKIIGFEIKWVLYEDWEKGQKDLEEGKIDLIHDLIITDQRAQSWAYTQSYLNQFQGVYTQKSSQIKSLADLKDATLAIPAGFEEINILKNHYPNIKITHADTPLDALKAVHFNHADATVLGSAVANYLISENALTNIQSIFSLGGANSLHMATTKNNQPLISLLDKAIKHFGRERMDRLKQKWFFKNESHGQEVDSGQVSTIAKTLATTLAKAAWEFDKDTLLNMMKSNIKIHHLIGIRIAYLGGKDGYLVYMQDGELHVVDSPQEFHIPANDQVQKVTQALVYDGEEIGEITIYGKVINTHLVLTKEERDWLQKHPVIKVHNEQDWPPFNFFENGKPQGISIDYMNLLAEKMGVKVEYVTGPSWDEFMKMAKDGKIDVMLNIMNTQERRKFLSFTTSYYSAITGIYTRKDHQSLYSFQDLKGKTVAVPKGFYYQEFIEKNYPEIKLLLKKNVPETLDAVAFGEADATVVQIAIAEYLLKKQMITNVVLTGKATDKGLTTQLSIGVNKKQKILRDIIQKAHESIDESERLKITNRWVFNEPPAARTMTLNKEERLWVQQHPIIKVSNEMDYPPFDFAIGKEPYGYSIDMLNLLSRRIGIKVEYVNGYSWDELMQMFKQKKLDVIHPLYQNSDRKKIGNFTHPLFRGRSMFITRADALPIKSVSDIQDKVIATTKSWATTKYFQEVFPGISLLLTDTMQDAFNAVSRGDAYATVEMDAVAKYVLKKEMRTDLKINSQFKEYDRDRNNNLHYLVRKDWPLLHQLLNKAMSSLGVQELDELQEKWFGRIDERQTAVLFTQEERAWIQAHPVIKVYNDKNYPPFDFNENGQPRGYTIDLIKELGRLIGMKIEWKLYTDWEKAKADLLRGELHLVHDVYKSKEREKIWAFTKYYLGNYAGIYANPASGIRSVKDFKGKIVAMPKGYYDTEWLKQHYPGMKVKEYPHPLDCLKAVNFKEADVTVIQSAVANYLISQYTLYDVVLQGISDINDDNLQESRFYMATSKSNRLLASILNKAMVALDPAISNRLKQTWLGFSPQNIHRRKVVLNEKEQAWLAKNPTASIVLRKAASPLSQGKDAQVEGFVPDLLKMISETTGLKFQIRTADWKENILAFQNGQVDLISDISYKKERESFSLFTKPYLEVPLVIFARNDFGEYRGAESLKEKMIGMTESVLLNEDFRKKGFNIKSYPNAKAYFRALAFGEVDVVFTSLLMTKFIQSEGYYNIRPIADASYVFGSPKEDLRFGITKSKPQLHTILQKAMDSLDSQQLFALKKKWFAELSTFETQKQIDHISLSKKEISWLQKHPVIKVSNELDYPPFDFAIGVKPQGYSIDLINLLAKKIGLKVEYINGYSWARLQKMLQEGKLDLVHTAAKTPQRESYALFGKPYYRYKNHFAIPVDQLDISRFDQLSGKRMAVVRGSYQVEFLKKNYPDIKLLLVDDYASTIEAVSTGQADATLEDRDVLRYIISKNGIRDVKVSGWAQEYDDNKNINLHYMAQKNAPELISMLDKAFESVNIEEMNTLNRKWFGGAENEKPTIPLNDKERSWLQKHPTIKASSELDYPPFDFAIEGQPTGYSIDLLNLLAERIGLRVEYVNGYTWTQLVELFKKGKLDLLHTLTKTSEREKIGLFSDIYRRNQTHFITRKSNPDIQGFDDLSKKIIAVGKGWSQEEFISLKHPEIKLLAMSNLDAIYESVSRGESYATLSHDGVARYLIKSKGYNDLKLAGWAKEFDQAAGSMGYRFLAHQDASELVSMLNKALVSLTPRDVEEIEQKWFGSIGEPSKKAKLTPEEQSFLNAHPVIKVSNHEDHAPISFVDERSGMSAGFSVDYMQLVSEATGLHIEYVNAPWSELMKKATNKEIDVLAGANVTEEREKFLSFTLPYLSQNPMVIFALEGASPVNSIKDLKGKKLAVGKGWAQEKYLREHHPEIELVPVDSTSAGIQALLLKKADAYLNRILVGNYYISNSFISGIKPVGMINDVPMLKGPSIHFGVRKDWPELVSIINKGMKTVTPEEIHALYARWGGMTDGEKVKRIKLISEEQKYLDQKGVIKYCVDPNWMPYERINDNSVYEGMGADYFALLTKRAGIRTELYPTITWSETLEAAQSRKCDMIVLAAVTEDRKEYMTYTDTFLSSPFVIVTKTDELFIENIENILDKTFAMVKGYSSVEDMKRAYPTIKILEVGNINEGLQAVREGKAYGYIDATTTIGYKLLKDTVTDLKIAGKTEFSFSLGTATRKDEPLLHSIMQKAINTLTSQEKQEIQNRWVSIKFEQATDYALMWKILLGGAVLLLGILWWNRKLTKFNKEVQAQKILAEQQSLEAKKAKSQAFKALAQTAELLNNSGEGFLSFGKNLLVNAQYSQECEILFGSKIAGEKVPQLLFPNDPHMQMETEEQLCSLFDEISNTQKRSIIETLPKETVLSERAISLKYSLIREPFQEESTFDNQKLLSEEERNYLEQKGAIVMCADPNWMPYERITEEGEHEGVAANYLRGLSKVLGIPLELKVTKTWTESLQAARSGECDILSFVARTEDRDLFLNYTDSYYATRYIPVSNLALGNGDYHQILKGKKIALAQGYSYAEAIQKELPENDFVLLDSMTDCFEAVREGRADVAFSHEHMEMLHETGWKVSDLKRVSDYVYARDYHIGVIKSELFLLEILNKAIRQNNAIMVVAKDVTYQKELEAQIKREHEQTTEALTQIETLLNNSGQGFLSFSYDLIVDKGYSLECENIFGGPIQGHAIDALLAPEDDNARHFVRSSIQKSIKYRDDAIRSEAFMSLIPAEYHLKDRYYRAEYRLLEDERMILILTDITDEKKLKERVEKEKKRLEFIVNAMENRNDLLETLRDYKQFRQRGLPDLLSKSEAPKSVLAEIYRHIHTFKGLFAQDSLPEIPKYLHDLESELGKLRNGEKEYTSQDIKMVFAKFDLGRPLEEDLKLLREKLGDSYFVEEKEITIPVSMVERLEEEALMLLRNEEEHILIKPENLKLLHSIRRMRYVTLESLLNPHFKAAEQLAGRLNKLIHPIRYQGDLAWVDPQVYGMFCKNLIHLFRNALDHGIEDEDSRFEADKDEVATITCEVNVSSAWLTLAISDDGQGIDPEMIKIKAVEKGLITTEEAERLSEQESLYLIFQDGLSTKEEVSAISGRGVGLGALYHALNKMDGRVEIQTERGKGSTFIFTLPYEPDENQEMEIVGGNELTRMILAPMKKVVEEHFKSALNMEIAVEEEMIPIVAEMIQDYTAQIRYDSLNIELGVSFPKNMLVAMTLAYVPECSQEEADEINEDIGSEIVNIIFGQATIYYSHLEKDIKMGTPVSIDAKTARGMLRSQKTYGMRGWWNEQTFSIYVREKGEM